MREYWPHIPEYDSTEKDLPGFKVNAEEEDLWLGGYEELNPPEGHRLKFKRCSIAGITITRLTNIPSRLKVSRWKR